MPDVSCDCFLDSVVDGVIITSIRCLSREDLLHRRKSLTLSISPPTSKMIHNKGWNRGTAYGASIHDDLIILFCFDPLPPFTSANFILFVSKFEEFLDNPSLCADVIYGSPLCRRISRRGKNCSTCLNFPGSAAFSASRRCGAAWIVPFLTPRYLRRGSEVDPVSV